MKDGFAEYSFTSVVKNKCYPVLLQEIESFLLKHSSSFCWRKSETISLAVNINEKASHMAVNF